jgi:hypothetical protein
MTSRTHFGGIVGVLEPTNNTLIEIRNVNVSGTLKYGKPTVDPWEWFIIGGLVGETSNTNTNVLIENCVSAVNIEADLEDAVCEAECVDTVVGGFVGKLFLGKVVIRNCSATGNINLVTTANRHTAAGGFIGDVANTAGSGTRNYTIENCYASGSVNVEKGNGSTWSYAGGLIGIYVQGTLNVKNCAALNPSVFASGGTGSIIVSSRVSGNKTGTTAGTANLENNVARKKMDIGTSTTHGTISSDDAAGENGLDKAVPGDSPNADDSADIITVLNTTDSTPQNVWEWNGATGLPRLR